MNATATHCQEMIRHYEEQASNWTKPQHWRDLASTSIAGWKYALERVQAGDTFWGGDDE